MTRISAVSNTAARRSDFQIGSVTLAKMGISSGDVRLLQQKLKEAGFDPGSTDGTFGASTEAAVRAFQEAKGLQLDGIAGQQTWGALFGIAAFSTSFSFLLVYWLLPKVGATNLSLNTFITPISAILLGVLVLHERFEAAHVIGVVVIFIGLIFMDGRLVRRRRAVA